MLALVIFMGQGLFALSRAHALASLTGWRHPAGLTPRDMWVWNNDVALDAAKRAELLAFAQAQDVRAVYLESEWLISHNQAALADFIAAAAGQGIQVELLFGYAAWALEANHDAAVSLAQNAVAFTNALSGPKPVALHYDVEPYALPEWSADENGTANQYLDLLEKLVAVTQGTGLLLRVDIPFWYDGREITRNGQTRPMHAWVLDIVDGATIMAYRDHADPPDGIIDHIANEMSYAASAGKKIVVGVETNCGLSPEKITFCEEGATALENALAAVQSAYASSSAFD
ncbi:MAG: hypothetical protein GXP42_16450, partial [Chloroflexi bacterium]|nr:hypothetical protein [Chloroflexota bacterium]